MRTGLPFKNQSLGRTHHGCSDYLWISRESPSPLSPYLSIYLSSERIRTTMVNTGLSRLHPHTMGQGGMCFGTCPRPSSLGQMIPSMYRAPHKLAMGVVVKAGLLFACRMMRSGTLIFVVPFAERAHWLSSRI